ncbi:MAG: 3-isopropylmalate dehydrogenase [Thermodesulfobacteriota bacterium]
MGRSHDIAVIPGDGVGPEVVREGLKVLQKVAEIEGFELNLKWYPFGGEHFLRTGETLPDSALEEMRQMQAVYLGAIGHPVVRPGLLEKEILLKIRFELDLYINLRPVELLPGVETPIKDKGPEEIDFVVVRENTEGLYTGAGGVMAKGTPFEVAVQESIQTRRGVERCIRYAFDLARNRSKKHKLTLCGKKNVLTYTFDLWDRVFEEIGARYQDIQRDYVHVDAICMWMVKNPEQFDVIVTDNMFGDIITDLGAAIQGGLGMAASGNIHPGGVSMFEPIHGSSPRHAGKGVINPLAAIQAAAMMLEHLGEHAGAGRIQNAVRGVVKKLKGMGAGQMGLRTWEVGDEVVKLVADPVQT